MSTTKLQSKPPTAAPETNVAVIHPETVGSDVGPLNQYGPDVSGEVLVSDMRLPRLALAQKTGALGELFAPGTIVLSKEVAILPLNEELDGVQVLKFKTEFREKVPFDEPRDERPKTWATVREVLAAGFSIDYGDENYAERIAHALLLIPGQAGVSADDLDNFFYYQFGKVRYAMAITTLAGSSYTESGKAIASALGNPMVIAAGGVRSCKWALSSYKKTSGTKSWFVMKMRRTGTFGQEMLDYTASIAPAL